MIGTDLDELRKNRNKDLIPEELVSSALNVYIENAMEASKKNNLIDVSKWDIVDSSGDHHSNEERRLIDQKLNRNVDDGSSSGNGVVLNKEEKDKELLNLAENGDLFHIDLNNVYESVGETQVENFGKMYGVH